MTDRTKQLDYLAGLADELTRRGLRSELAGQISRPYLRVANSETPTLNERVHCQQSDDGSWEFCWPWKQVIGSVDDLESVTEKIAAVLRSVDGADAGTDVSS